MKLLFRPAIALMNRLNYPRKFAVISLLFAFPLALVLYFLNAQAITIQPVTYLASATQALDASFDLWDSTVTELDRLLQARIDGFAQRKNLVATVTVLVLVIVPYLFAGFYLAVTSTIANLDEASKRMVSGNLDALVDLDNRDELGQVVKSFNTIATHLTALSQAMENLARAGTLHDIAGLLEQAEIEYERMQTALETVRKEL